MKGNIIFCIGVVIIIIAASVFWSSYSLFDYTGMLISAVMFGISFPITMIGWGMQNEE